MSARVNDLRIEVIKALSFHRFKGKEIRILVQQILGVEKPITQLNQVECEKILAEIGINTSQVKTK
ncbi:hypothetical protein [Effusibacillus pohliae]|uniref:hypothetical protein n=1 Tax=Effusibacillus pohliae TaxID=232270 RepID=UPI00036392E3|nr:hypothetical protein [Effusibacillus pohliae]